MLRIYAIFPIAENGSAVRQRHTKVHHARRLISLTIGILVENLSCPIDIS